MKTFWIVLIAAALCLSLRDARPAPPSSKAAPQANTQQAAPSDAPSQGGPTDPGVMPPHVSPAMRRYSRTLYILDFALPAYQLLMLWIILRTGLSANLRDKALSLSRRRFLTLIWYVVFFTVVTLVLNLPTTVYSDYWLEHQYGLSHELFWSWIERGAKSTAVNAAVELPVVYVLYALMRRRPRDWEFRLWVILIPLTAIAVFAQPLVISPIFNKFTPLPQSALRTQIAALAGKAGIPNAPILVADMSKETETTNAYVDGVGSSARIVIWDTTLKQMPRDQILAIVGHEMGHYVLKHIYWGFLASLVFMLVGLPIVRRVYDWLVSRNAARWHLDGPTDFAAIPVLLFTVTLLGFFASPIVNGTTRIMEHQADAYGLRVTGNRGAMARAFVSLSEHNLSDPNPPALVHFWFGSHPTLQQRIDFALGKNK